MRPAFLQTDDPAAIPPQQQVVRASLADLPERVQVAGLSARAVIVVGQVAALSRELDWFVASSAPETC